MDYRKCPLTFKKFPFFFNARLYSSSSTVHVVFCMADYERERSFAFESWEMTYALGFLIIFSLVYYFVTSVPSVPSAVVYYYCAWYTFFGTDIKLFFLVRGFNFQWSNCHCKTRGIDENFIEFIKNTNLGPYSLGHLK